MRRSSNSSEAPFGMGRTESITASRTESCCFERSLTNTCRKAGDKIKSSFLRGGGFKKDKQARKREKDKKLVTPPWIAKELKAVKDQQKNKQQLSLSNLLSVQEVEKDTPSSPTPRRGSANAMAVASARGGEVVDSSGPTLRHSRSSKIFHMPVLSRMISNGLDGDSVDPFDDSHKPFSYVSPELNKKFRTVVFQQSWLTNRFRGTPQAEFAENEFALYISTYQLKRVRYRLAATGVLLFISAFEQPLTQDGTFEMNAYLMLHTFLPMIFLLSGALLCLFSVTKAYWRWWVVLTGMLSYASVLWSDAFRDVSKWSASRQDYSTMLQTVWLLIWTQFFALGFSLDFVYVFIVVSVQWICFLTGVLYMQSKWDAFYQDRRIEYDLFQNMKGECEKAVNMTFNEEADNAANRWRYWALCEGIVVATLAVGLLLYSVQRLNRFERQSFVNSYVLLNKTVNEAKRNLGGGRELLALFSNPSAPQQLQLKPLQLGQELKFLLRSIPNSYLACEPAASLADVEEAIQRADPSLILFSGHSFAGSLAFELPNGRIDLPPPEDFIHQLKQAPRLICCFLNGCNTSDLGVQIVKQLPHLKVICWATVAEDAAARSFALGFYDTVGALLASAEQIKVELAFWAGLQHFASDGFKLGDPIPYLHPPAHPHTFRPQFSPPCEGCSPPVHGQVQLLRLNPKTLEPQKLRINDQSESYMWESIDAQEPLSPRPSTDGRDRATSKEDSVNGSCKERSWSILGRKDRATSRENSRDRRRAPSREASKGRERGNSKDGRERGSSKDGRERRSSGNAGCGKHTVGTPLATIASVSASSDADARGSVADAGACGIVRLSSSTPHVPRPSAADDCSDCDSIREETKGAKDADSLRSVGCIIGNARLKLTAPFAAHGTPPTVVSLLRVLAPCPCSVTEQQAVACCCFPA